MPFEKTTDFSEIIDLVSLEEVDARIDELNEEAKEVQRFRYSENYKRAIMYSKFRKCTKCGAPEGKECVVKSELRDIPLKRPHRIRRLKEGAKDPRRTRSRIWG